MILNGTLTRGYPHDSAITKHTARFIDPPGWHVATMLADWGPRCDNGDEGFEPGCSVCEAYRLYDETGYAPTDEAVMYRVAHSLEKHR